MIDRSRRHFCLQTSWFVGGIILSVVVIVIDRIATGGFHLLSWLATLVTLLPPLAVLATVGILKCETFIKRSAGRIAYTCPKCSRQSEPLFRCPGCEKPIEDLGASLSGVFSAHCECGQVVPTCDWSGRLQLVKVCRHCSADLNDADLGKQPEYRIALVGAPSAGKTNLMISAIWCLEHRFAKPNNLELHFSSPSEERVYRDYIALLESGHVMEKTITLPIPRAFTLSIRSEEHAGCLLYLYDAAGEDFEEEARLVNHPIEQHDGIWFVVDPLAEKCVRDELVGDVDEEQIDEANPAPLEAAEILGRLVGVLERIHGTSVGGKFPIPIAVTVSKLDACGLSKLLPIPPDQLDRYYPTLGFAADCTEAYSSHVRRFLTRVGLGNFVRMIESRFPRAAFFAASALGRFDNPGRQSALAPRGALAPLLWLCYHVNAICDTGSFDRTFLNWNLYLIRILRGREGRTQQQIALAVIVVLALLVLTIFLSFNFITIMLCGGLHFFALVIIYILCFIVLVVGRHEK